EAHAEHADGMAFRDERDAPDCARPRRDGARVLERGEEIAVALGALDPERLQPTEHPALRELGVPSDALEAPDDLRGASALADEREVLRLFGEPMEQAGVGAHCRHATIEHRARDLIARSCERERFAQMAQGLEPPTSFALGEERTAPVECVADELRER